MVVKYKCTLNLEEITMFKKAKAIFINNEELNTFACFKTNVNQNKKVKIRLTANSFYKLFINGNAIAFGPCRTAKGYARVDEILLDDYLTNENNEIAILVAGYNCKSLSTCKFNSFLTAEIYANNEIIAYTGKDFKGYAVTSRVKKVYRYSMQRHFSEVIDFNNGSLLGENEVETVTVLEPKYLPRRVNYPKYQIVNTLEAEVTGTFTKKENFVDTKGCSSWRDQTGSWGILDSSEIKYNPRSFIQSNVYNANNYAVKFPITINENEYAIFDLGVILTGFLGFEIACDNFADVCVAYSENSNDGEFTFVDGFNAYNSCEYIFNKGKFNFETFEPFTAKKIIICAKKGSVKINAVNIKTYEGNFDNIKNVEFTDDELNLIYKASVTSFTQNAVDLYTDCPSRERAGWLCDSYFTGKTEYFLTNKTTVEDAFLENYVYFENVEGYEEGMIPMCYPSDNKLEFIPQWSMWFILEVEEYLLKRNGALTKEQFKPVIYKLLDYYKRYENEDGLLEKLSSWNFVEWSKANSLTNGVNYPTNFLYAKVLDCVYNIYGDETCLNKAKNVRKIAISQSFDGKLFHDLATRDENGKLVLNDDITEICQYYAILFSGIDVKSEKYSYLYNTVTRVFNKDRTVMPEIEKINMFIGVYLKLLALDDMGENELLIQTVKDYFLPMAKTTGTLWEYVTVSASLCHGFASVACVIIEKAGKALNLIK